MLLVDKFGYEYDYDRIIRRGSQFSRFEPQILENKFIEDYVKGCIECLPELYEEGNVTFEEAEEGLFDLGGIYIPDMTQAVEYYGYEELLSELDWELELELEKRYLLFRYVFEQRCDYKYSEYLNIGDVDFEEVVTKENVKKILEAIETEN